MRLLLALSARARRLAPAIAGLALAGCAPMRVPAEPTQPLGMDFVTDYGRLPKVVFMGGSGEKRWVIQPRSVSIFEGTFLKQVIDRQSGLSGSIVAAEEGFGRLWLGTTEGVFALDMTHDDLKSFEDGSNPVDDHVVCIDARNSDGQVWIVTRTGLILIDTKFDLRETSPFERPILPKMNLVAVDQDFVWVAAASQIDRYSKRWHRWDNSYTLPTRGKPLLRLAADGANELWAITEDGLYRYDRGFDTWKSAQY